MFAPISSWMVFIGLQVSCRQATSDRGVQPYNFSCPARLKNDPHFFSFTTAQRGECFELQGAVTAIFLDL